MSKPAVSSPAVLITGASSGIGLACVETLLSRGVRVYAGVRDLAACGELAGVASAALTLLELDVTRLESIQQAARRIESDLAPSGLQGLVNNAGIATAGPLECIAGEQWRRLLEVNVIGLMDVTRAMLPALRRGQGRIINIGSASGRIARPFLGPYCASKFALEALTDSLRMELSPSGLLVIMISVGRVRTPLWSKAASDLQRLIAALPEDQRRYAPPLEALVAWTRRSGGIAPRHVAAIIAEALSAPRPKRRYVAGYNRWTDLALRLLPSTLSDWLLTRKLPKYG